MSVETMPDAVATIAEVYGVQVLHQGGKTWLVGYQGTNYLVTTSDTEKRWDAWTGQGPLLVKRAQDLADLIGLLRCARCDGFARWRDLHRNQRTRQLPVCSRCISQPDGWWHQ